MKRLCISLLFSFFVMMASVLAQSHISRMFDLEEEWTLRQYPELFRQQGVVGCVDNNVLYCCHRRGFQSKDDGYRARVYTVDLGTGEEGVFFLSLPEKKSNAATARKYWIRGVFVEGIHLLLSVQDEVLFFRKGKAGRYEFVKRLSSDLPERVDRSNGQLSVIERVPEIGKFILKRQQGQAQTMAPITEFSLPGPFMLQYEPNGFVKMKENTLYFLASPELRIEKYSFSGELLAVIRPQLSAWQAIPDELIRKISEMPYGSDRAMYTFFHTKQNSFPLEITPLQDTILLLSYHHYDTLEKHEKVLTALVVYDERGDICRVEPFTHFFNQDSVIGDSLFPLYYAQRELCLQVTYGDRLVQVVREAPIEWRGKTGREYTNSVERYFADGIPEFRVRVAKLQTRTAERRCTIDNLGLRTYEGNVVMGKELASSNVIFIVNNPPQCHSCEETLLSFLNTVDTTACKVCIVFNNADSYMAKRDQIENVSRQLSIPIKPLFVPTSDKAAFMEQLGEGLFPVVMLKSSDCPEAVVIPNGQIFVEDRTSALKTEFVSRIRKFVQRKGYVRK